MASNARIYFISTKTLLMGSCMSAALVFSAATASAQQAPADTVETINVSGYASSLEKATLDKKNSVGFTDSIFAEDIGKFPDSNIAESLNRIPGVTISREVDGEGVNVSIRGLGTNFTKILLNGNPIAVASTGGTDSANNNREVDLNMFPTELFTKLTVSKSPMADQIEGGAAGSVTMRSSRPFDNPGMHFTYNLQLTDQSTTNNAVGKRGSLIFSDTEGPFGVLVGVTGVQSNQMVKGWEDGNAGWNTANLPAGACATGNTCAQFGGGSWTIPASVPGGVQVPIPTGFTLAPGFAPNVIGGTNYFPTNYPVSSSMLYALNPGLADSTCSATAPTTACVNQAMTRLSNSLLPRLGRPMFEKGTRDRYNAIVSLEYRPTNALHFYNDFIFGRTFNNLNRSDIDWGVRGGNSSTTMIPANLTLQPDWLADPNTAGLGGAVKSGNFYNAVFGLEARPYMEKSDFIAVNPGVSWVASDLLVVDLQANYSRSHFLRNSPTIMVTSCTATAPVAGISNCPNGAPALGTVLNFDNTGATPFPAESLNLNLNDPGNFEWNLGRVNLSSEKRYTYTAGAHLDVTYGGDKFAIKAGGAYDDVYRIIEAIDDSARWQNAVCGDSPNVYLPGPNTALPGCTGQSTTSVPAGYATPAYPGYGTGYSTGFPALAYQGSLVPTAGLANYLTPGPTGFITVNYNKILAATNYYQYFNNAWAAVACAPHCNVTNPPFAANANTGGGTGAFDEKTIGLYAKAVGDLDISGHSLKYDIGLRWVQTLQDIITPVNTVDPRNSTLADGGKYPNYFAFQPAKNTYQAFLPSLSAVYQVADDFQVRASISRTMTRPNPANMTGALQFSDPNVTSASLGNPNLAPFFSNNIDIGAEYYTGGEGYFGMSMFRKSISGFTANITTSRNFAYLAQYGITYNSLGAQQQLNYNTTGGPSGIPCNSDATCANQPVSVSQQVNLKGLEIINGVEFDYVQPLDFLLESYGLKGFGFTGNVTIIDQKSTGSVPTYATGVAPLQYNLTSYYENRGAMIRLSYNWNDKTYGSGSNAQNVCLPAAASGTKPVGCPGGAYLFNAPYGQADISSSLKLSSIFGPVLTDPELTFDVQNLFSAKSKSYFQLPDAPHTYYVKGQTFMLGFRGRF